MASHDELIDELVDRSACWRTLLVVGRSDSGKTTFASRLSRRLAGHGGILRVDCDPGQGTIGPPATVGAEWEPSDQGDPRPSALWFVGATSPSGHLPQILAGLARLLRLGKAEASAWTLVDDSGYFASVGGAELHHLTAEVVSPDHLVALQDRKEPVQPLLSTWDRRVGTRVHRLPIPHEARPRSREARRRLRRERFARHFDGAEERTLQLSRIGLHGWVPDLSRADAARDLLLGLCDEEGFLISLARLEAVDLAGERLTVLAPPFGAEAVASVAFGTVRLDPEEVGRG